MSPRPAIAVGALALLLAMAVFQLKFVVRERERELAQTRRSIEEQRSRIRTLAADWAWLTRPERVTAQARQLGLEPMRAERLARVGDLPDATALAFAGRTLTVELGDGLAVELRFKPAPTPTAGPAGRR